MLLFLEKESLAAILGDIEPATRLVGFLINLLSTDIKLSVDMSLDSDLLRFGICCDAYVFVVATEVIEFLLECSVIISVQC